MKKAFITLLVIAMVLIFVACNQDSSSDTATLALNISTTRTIVPEDYDLTVAKYHITGQGPSSDDTFDITTAKTYIRADGLAIGDWTIEGEGLNSDGTVLVTGSTEFYLSASNTTTTLTLSELVGSGTLSLTFTWEPEALTDPDDVELLLILTDQDASSSETLEPTINTSTGIATYSGTWAAGSYTLTAKLYCNDVLVAGTAEAVRIADGVTSEGTIAFTIDSSVESGIISIANNSGTPVSLTSSGLDDTVTAGVSIEVSLSSADDDSALSDFDISWYLDGESIGEGDSVTISPNIGNHILSAIATSSSLVGATGSASVSFEAIQKGTNGAPSQSIKIDTSSGLNLGSGTFIRFLNDGRLMVVSNSEKTIQLATLVKDSISIEKEFTFSNLGISGTVTAFDVGYVSDSLYVVAIGTESSFSLNVYNFLPASNTFSLVASTTSVTVGNKIDSTYSEVKADGVEMAFVTPENDEVLFFLTASSGTYGDLMHYDFTDGSTLFDSTKKVGYIIDNMFVSNTPSMGVASETMAMFASTSGIIAGMTNWDGDSSGGSFKSPINFNNSYALGSTDFMPLGLCFLGDYSLYTQTDSFDAYLYYYNGTYKYTKYATDGHIKQGLSSSPDLDYAYYIDQKTGELVTLYFSSESAVPETLSTFSLSSTSTPDTIVVSKSGANLVLYNDSNPSEIEVVRIYLD